MPEVAKTKVSFNKSGGDGYLRDVRGKVDEYFASQGIPKTANRQMILKTIIILTGWVVTYGLIMSNLLPGYILLLLALMHGFFTALIGLNIAHDAIHGSYSRHSRVNKKIGLLFNLIGANDYVWNISHNVVHHTYTNIPDHDDDINQPGVLRLEQTQKLRWIHRFQHVYALVLYSFSSLSWVFVKDYVMFFKHQLGGHFRERFPRKEMIRLFAYKLIYYAIFLILPVVFIDLPWYWIVFGFILSHLVEGFTLAIVFMLAHVIEGTHFPEVENNGSLDMTWAELQMQTTSNFAGNSKVAAYLFGGLNFQIEHHLFPDVCHIHYPAIARIVQKTSKAHDLAYIEHPTFLGAIASHRRVLRAMGRPVVKTA